MLDTNNPVINPELRQSIRNMYRENTRDSQERALEQLTRAQLLAPVRIDREKGGKGIQFMLLSTQDGRSFLPAFTDLKEVRKGFSDPEQQTLVLSFADYANMILRDNCAAGLVVDPFGDSLTLMREMVEHVAGTMGARGQMKITRPEQWPEELAAAVTRKAADIPEVTRIWLRWAEKLNGEQGYLLLVEHTGQEMQILESLVREARSCLDGERADMVSYDARYEDAVRDVTPIFER